MKGAIACAALLLLLLVFYMDGRIIPSNVTDLPEVVVESRQNKALHMLAYIREYSTLTTSSDTIFLFREKMADFMTGPGEKSRFRGWTSPRLLKCESYYRFTDRYGRDSVSDNYNNHFSWADWVGIPPVPIVPPGIRGKKAACDSLRGKYSPAEIWIRRDDRFIVDVDVLADAESRKWVPNLSGFFRKGVEFNNFNVRFNYDNVVGDSIAATDLTGYTFTVESRGRGRNMFSFNRYDEDFYVTTRAEVYILDREYITLKEAARWCDRKFDREAIEIIEAPEAPDLPPDILRLMARVGNIDIGSVRLAGDVDMKMLSSNFGKKNRNFTLGNRLLSIFKQVTGITLYKSHRNSKNKWEEFRKERIRKNRERLQSIEPLPPDTVAGDDGRES